MAQDQKSCVANNLWQRHQSRQVLLSNLNRVSDLPIPAPYSVWSLGSLLRATWTSHPDFKTLQTNYSSTPPPQPQVRDPNTTHHQKDYIKKSILRNGLSRFHTGKHQRFTCQSLKRLRRPHKNGSANEPGLFWGPPQRVIIRVEVRGHGNTTICPAILSKPYAPPHPSSHSHAEQLSCVLI